jgi:hypothetical protein
MQTNLLIFGRMGRLFFGGVHFRDHIGIIHRGTLLRFRHVARQRAATYVLGFATSAIPP